ncbi:Poly [ADP-ribose] polymerase 1 [Geodia barretti]|nr:Poly [ADP-ribose] polymerase 1 [Geodia barretti]
MGGKVVSKVSEITTICLSSQGEVDKNSKKMSEVGECEVPVVDEAYLEDARKGGALLKIPSHTISSWGAPRHSLTAEEMTDCGTGSFKSSGSDVMKLTVKGSSAVDPESGLETSHHVLEEGGVVFNAVLGLVDIKRGTNSYYKLQLLEGDTSKNYKLFRSWGRVGTTIGGNKLESYGASKAAAKEGFSALFLDKTGNSWKDRGDTFIKKPNKFYPLEIDYGTDEGVESAVLLKGVGSKSTLQPAVQDLVRLIFDVESMKRAMMEFEIDMKKMPLGKLSNRQMRSAYAVLTELQQEVAGAANPARILDASNRFYTLIPHDFGLKKPPLLDTEEIIKTKTQMVDNLLEIEVAYSLLQEEQKGDPIDTNYTKLKTDLQVLPKDGEEFVVIQEYVANTHAATHSSYTLEVLEVFSTARHRESKRYKPFSKLANRMLLWHGSRVTNFAGILSQGLRIAPPEAPVTGYMFGKGVYFSDMVSKSANYCRTSHSDPVGLLLLCEVALGDMYELTRAQFIAQLPAGKHSTKGMGLTAPDPTGQIVTEKGVVIPKGCGKPTSVSNTSLLYNEYIVYDVAQISIRYLLKCNFH